MKSYSRYFADKRKKDPLDNGRGYMEGCIYRDSKGNLCFADGNSDNMYRLVNPDKRGKVIPKQVDDYAGTGLFVGGTVYRGKDGSLVFDSTHGYPDIKRNGLGDPAAKLRFAELKKTAAGPASGNGKSSGKTASGKTEKTKKKK